jgi:hypothetical protein
VFSAEHSAYWRPGAAGYTSAPDEAGVWTRERAVAITHHCGPEKAIRFESTDRALSEEAGK